MVIKEFVYKEDVNSKAIDLKYISQSEEYSGDR